MIVAARDESATIAEGARSHIEQEYADLELILVDDRSTDGTGGRMRRLAERHPGRVRTISVSALPPGWLGKNHALWVGARAASGERLLFTDADVVFESSCVRRAAAYAEAEGIDHLTLAPEIPSRGYWLSGFIRFFTWAFLTSQRPYLANEPGAKHGVGIGSFNLIRSSTYEAIGTHQAISLRPDDDLRLGLRVKRHGFRQRVLGGAGLLRVEWYPSLGTAIRGLEKNAYAGLGYSIPRVVGSIGALLVATVLPYPAVVLTRGAARRLYAAAIATQLAHFAYANRGSERGSWRYVPAFPLLSLLFSYTVLRAVWLTLRRGSVAWRGTLYPLEELRRQTGLE